jgi:SAM-dependent methyltransferase
MTSNAYDQVLYEGHPFSQTHPDRLATVARMFGMAPASPGACRFLEIGCGDGGNLIPMGYSLPGSRFVGLDAGGRGIEKGRALAEEAGVRNVELLHSDILEAGASLGTFDYIVAHGVYSWVPPAVQEKVLALCGELLKPHGVAYISYSVYPGAHIRRMLAEMLQYHAGRFDEPQVKIEQARAMLAFLAEARTTQDAYSLLLRQEVERLALRRPATLFHDELSPHHEAVYFHDFAERAEGHGLQYLGEADFAEMQETGLPAEAVAALRQLGPNLIEREQHLDFLKCRRFRQTLLCRADVALDRRIRSEQVREFFIRAVRVGDEGATQSAITNHPAAEAASKALDEVWPAALSFEELLAAVADDDAILTDIVLAHYACGRFELRTEAPHFARWVSERPQASAVARAQARTAQFVTNLCHTPVRLDDDWSRALLQLLDGTRDRGALLAAMRAAAGERANEVHESDLESSLERLAAIALLET